MTYLLVLWVNRSDAVQCYYCSSTAAQEDSENCLNPNMNTSTCNGGYCSLIINTAVGGYGTFLSRGCETGEAESACIKMELSGSPITACTCNTALCNQADVSTAVGAITTPSSLAHRCYSCQYVSSSSDNENCKSPGANTTTCAGEVCLSGTVNTGGQTTIVRSCVIGTTDTMCYSLTYNGAPVRLCSCDADLCNAASSRFPKFIPMMIVVLALHTILWHLSAMFAVAESV
jgi:hypothetical protein